MVNHPTIASDISAGDLAGQIAEVQVVDVRSPGEFASGHIPGAISIPLEQLEARREDLAMDRPIVLVCQAGHRAGLACEWLGDLRRPLLRLTGGTVAWIEGGNPVVRSSAARWSLERQVRLAVGVLALVGSTLALTVSPLWAALPLFLGAGLTFAGLTDICGLALLLGRLPWNRKP